MFEMRLYISLYEDGELKDGWIWAKQVATAQEAQAEGHKMYAGPELHRVLSQVLENMLLSQSNPLRQEIAAVLAKAEGQS